MHLGPDDASAVGQPERWGCLLPDWEHLISAMRRLSAQITLVKRRLRRSEHLISAMRRLSA
jgi:hypothetical protein